MEKDWKNNLATDSEWDVSKTISNLRMFFTHDENLRQIRFGTYLVPVKVGNKNMYAMSEIRRIRTGGRNDTVTNYCKRKEA